jgi:hypothetical protein
MATLAVALGGGDAMAATPVSQSGVVGNVTFQDSPTTPQARCLFDGAAGHSYFSGMRVKAPSIFWPNQSISTPNEHGTVGWRVKVQHWNGASWATVNTSPESQATASENTAAAFVTKTVPHGLTVSHRYRALVVITWYTGPSSQLGQAKVLIDWYRRIANGKAYTSCKGIVCDVCGPGVQAVPRPTLAAPDRRATISTARSIAG